MLRRLLNIASIVCLVACVALMGMWVRSYSWSDRLWGRFTEAQVFSIGSQSGRLRWASMSLKDRTWSWTIGSRPIESVRETEFWQFNEYHSGKNWFLVLPHWFAILVSGSLAMALRLRWPWRFTLRSLFIATTFLAVVLGMIAWVDRAWIGK
jgi:hypothetical protein